MEHIKNMKIESTPKKLTNSYLKNLHKETHKGFTANGAVTLTASGSNLLDFYAQAGSMRKNKGEALNLFKKAFAEDRQSAVRILFYLRDVRGGQGERDLFRTCLECLGTDYPEIFEKIIQHVPEFGRWDDLFFNNEKCFDFLSKQLGSDEKADAPSLLAKWLPTMNASSGTTRAKAKFMALKLDMNDIEYRRTLRDIRKKIATVEEKMSAREWENIDYSTVPSQASRIYKNAFKKHDEVRYGKFIEKAKKGEVKINASTLYPYQIYKDVQKDYSKTLEALWNQLPDYTRGKNALVVADVSGSMEGDPMSVSVSLALYFAERNQGQFKDHFITFSGRPTLQRIIGSNLREKMNNIERADWAMNTNLQAVFDLILDTATRYETPANEMPETIYIISDMEFDNCTSGRTNLEVIKTKYEQSGYKAPNLVFWNVNGRGKNLPVGSDERGVTMVSGYSPVAFKFAVENKTAEEVMFETINSPRYEVITL